jgi:inner membrane protein
LENVTHTLTGFFLSHAGLNRFTPNATILLVLSANAPDIDILGIAGGRLNYFHYHRHFTHSLLFAPILAVVLVALVRFVGRKPIPWVPAFLVALGGVLSHLLLDLTNEYGIRLFLPFSDSWPALDITAIYDIWIWCFFALCLAAPLLSKLVGSEIGASSRRLYPSRFFPCLALIFLLLYDGGRTILHNRALSILDSRQYDDAPALRVAAFPNPSNPLRWRGLAETATAYRLYDIDLLSSFNPARGEVAFKAEPSPQIEAANRTEPFRILRNFARFPIWRSLPTDSGMQVIFSDIRFPFFCQADLDRAGKIETSAFSFGR